MRPTSGILVVLILARCGGSTAPTDGTSTSVASVTVSPLSLSLYVGESKQLTAIPKNDAGAALGGHTASWESSDPAVATVSPTGEVTGIAVGSATVTATSEGKSGTAAVSVLGLESFVSVFTGGAHTCALTAAGAGYCWGRGESGQLGIPPPAVSCITDAGPMACSMVPVAVTGGLTFTQLTGGGAHTCGLTGDGSAYCWGANGSGQLGDNSRDDRDAPVPVATGVKFVSLDAGAFHTCGIALDGTLYCWGRNDLGQLGDGTTTARSVPTAVTGGLTFRQVAAGGFDIGHTCGLTTDGVAYCWGANDLGQLGDGHSDGGAASPHPLPVPVAGGARYSSLSAALARFACALTPEGTAYCWGENAFGALGNGTTQDNVTPVPVSGGHAFTKLAAGGYIGHTCGLIDTGAAYCWGEGSVGQIGDGTTSDRLVPVPVDGGLVFTTLDAGFRHTCGRASTGALYCWGGNGAGQLGNNGNVQRDRPTKVAGQP